MSGFELRGDEGIAAQANRALPRRQARVIPAFVTAMQDRALRGLPRDVYLWCHEHLDVLEFRTVKQSVIEAELGMDDAGVARSLEKLVTSGYLERGERDGRLWKYRLLYSRREASA